MMRITVMTMLLLAISLNCGGVENHSDKPHSSGISDISQCYLDAGCVSLDLKSLRDTSGITPEIRVWLFEGEGSLFLLRRASDNNKISMKLAELTLFNPDTDSNAEQEHGVKPFWCDILDVYITFKVRSVSQLNPEWKDIFQEAEKLARDQVYLDSSGVYHPTELIIEFASGDIYSNSIISEPDERRSDAERIAEHIRSMILETVKAQNQGEK